MAKITVGNLKKHKQELHKMVNLYEIFVNSNHITIILQIHTLLYRTMEDTSEDKISGSLAKSLEIYTELNSMIYEVI